MFAQRAEALLTIGGFAFAAGGYRLFALALATAGHGIAVGALRLERNGAGAPRPRAHQAVCIGAAVLGLVEEIERFAAEAIALGRLHFGVTPTHRSRKNQNLPDAHGACIAPFYPFAKAPL